MISAIAAVLVQKERALVAQFERLRATTPAAALPLDGLGLEETVAFKRLTRAAVIRRTPDGRFHVDQASWIAMQATRRRRLLLVAGTALSAIVLVFLNAVLRAPGR